MTLDNDVSNLELTEDDVEEDDVKEEVRANTGEVLNESLDEGESPSPSSPSAGKLSQ